MSQSEPPTALSITVETDGSGVYTVTVESSWTLEMFAIEFGKVSGTADDGYTYIFYYQQRLLDNSSDTLESYGIKSGDTVNALREKSDDDASEATHVSATDGSTDSATNDSTDSATGGCCDCNWSCESICNNLFSCCECMFTNCCRCFVSTLCDFCDSD